MGFNFSINLLQLLSTEFECFHPPLRAGSLVFQGGEESPLFSETFLFPPLHPSIDDALRHALRADGSLTDPYAVYRKPARLGVPVLGTLAL